VFKITPLIGLASRLPSAGGQMLPPAPLNKYSIENYVHIGTFKKLQTVM